MSPTEKQYLHEIYMSRGCPWVPEKNKNKKRRRSRGNEHEHCDGGVNIFDAQTSLQQVREGIDCFSEAVTKT
jgi:hypothetical protein